MALYVRVHRPGTGARESASQFDGPFHGMAGEVAGFAYDSNGYPRVLVALEDGTLVPFAPSDLRAGKVVYNRQPE